MGRKQTLQRNYDEEGNLISKECNICHEIKPVSEFSKSKTAIDGLQLKCKECSKKYRQENKNRIKGEKNIIQRIYDEEGNLISKECSRCHEIKPVNEFNKCKSKADGFQITCKECLKKYKQGYYQENKDKIRGQHQGYYQENKDKIKEQRQEYYQENKDKIKYYQHEYQQENKDKIREREQEYRQENKDKIRERKQEYRQKIIQESLQQIKEEIEKEPEKYDYNPDFKIYGIIYLVLNSESDKYYVGQTTIGFDNRYKKGWLYEHSKKDTVKHDLELYGENSFKYIKIFKVAYSQYELDKLEAYYINYYDSYEKGYNENRGNIFTDRGKEK